MLSCFSRVQLFVRLWTVARQAPLSMGFSRQEYWSGLPCPIPGDLPEAGTEPTSLSLHSIGRPAFYHQCHLGSLKLPTIYIKKIIIISKSANSDFFFFSRDNTLSNYVHYKQSQRNRILSKWYLEAMVWVTPVASEGSRISLEKAGMDVNAGKICLCSHFIGNVTTLLVPTIKQGPYLLFTLVIKSLITGFPRSGRET